MNKRIISLVTCFMLVFSMLFGLEISAKDSVTVTVSAQVDGQFKAFNKQVTIEQGIAGEYGFENSSIVSESGITVMDALVALHKEIYGAAFTKTAMTEYLQISANDYGSMGVQKLFGTPTAYFGFVVDGYTPNDGVYSKWGATSYAVDQAEIKDGQSIDFFTYRDTSAWADSFVFVSKLSGEQSKISNEVREITVDAGEEFEVSLKGYSVMFSGSQPFKAIETATLPIKNAQLAIVSENNERVDIAGAITSKDGTATLKFDSVGRYQLTAYESAGSESKIIMPSITVDVEQVNVSDNWQNDIFLQYDFKQMKTGDTARIFPRRIEQIVSSLTGNEIVRPNFNFEIVSGNSIQLSATKSSDSTTVKAVKEGLSIVKVTYDEIAVDDKVYGATAKENAAYVAFDVNNDRATSVITTNIKETSYDTIYYTEGSSTPYQLKVRVSDGATKKVRLNGSVVKAKDGKYNLNLLNRQNIISVETVSADGRKNCLVKTLDARKIEITIENLTNAGNAIAVGDQVKVSFKGISNPIPKLVGIYNPTFVNETWGNVGTAVVYTLNSKQTVFARCAQYDLATNNSIIFTVDKEGENILSGGKITTQWWGDVLGSDKKKDNKNVANLSAEVNNAEFCSLPVIKFNVEKKVDVSNKDVEQHNETLINILIIVIVGGVVIMVLVLFIKKVKKK